MRGSRWVRSALVVCAVLAVHASALAAPEWRSLTDGYGWPPCGSVSFVIDVDSVPAGVSEGSVRADLVAAAGRVNAAVGRELVRIAPGTTTADPDPADDLNVVHFTSLVPDDPTRIKISGYAATSWQTYGDGSGEIIDADVVMDDGDWDEAPADLRVVTLAHEFGHALGLDHVGDAHEVMSYAFIDDGDGLGPGTAQALRSMYTGAGCDLRRLDGSHDWTGLTANGPRALELELGAGAADVRTLAVQLGQQLGAQWGGGQWATHAVVCRADLFPDCLAGAPLAGNRAPLVFVPGGPGGTITPADPTYQFLQSAIPQGAPVYVLGGDQAVSTQIVDTLAARWPDTRRLAGAGRFETAIEVAREVRTRTGGGTSVALARADNPADAVTGGAAAALRGLPILLTTTGFMPESTRSALAEFGTTQTLVLGGEAAVGAPVVADLVGQGWGPVRIAGRSRTETSVAIATHPALWGRNAVVDGDAFFGLNGWHDETWAVALASAPLAALAEAPILLTTGDGVSYAPPADGFPGDTAYYLSHLAGTGNVQMVYVGTGRWADAHARDSFYEYLGLY